MPYDFDGDGVPDFLDPDNDHDSSATDKTVGLDDKFELTNAAGTYVGLVDTDGDGIPDLWDRDSDNDGILDLDDGLGDPDKDGKRNFHDIDSDGDGVARAKASASAADYGLPLLDTDKDGKPDYVDVDSDGDLITDGKEDLNGNCVAESTETDRLKKDTDGDGVDDLHRGHARHRQGGLGHRPGDDPEQGRQVLLPRALLVRRLRAAEPVFVDARAVDGPAEGRSRHRGRLDLLDAARVRQPEDEPRHHHRHPQDQPARPRRGHRGRRRHADVASRRRP